MIQIDQLSFHYQRQALYQNFSLSFNTTGVYGLLGKNGTGKTTLLSLIAGSLFAKKGTIRTLDHNPKERSAEMLSQLFYLPEQLQLPALSVKKYMALYSPFYPNFSESDFQNYANTLEVDTSKTLKTMSMGQQKKFALAFGLACHCPLNLLDEPTNGLDIPSKNTFRQLINNAASEDKTFIISTHQVKDIETIIDRICMIEKGQVILQETVENIHNRLLMQTQTELVGDELYHQKEELERYAVIKPNDLVEHSLGTLDLELLFNAMLSDPIAIQKALAQTKDITSRQTTGASNETA